MDKLSAPVGQAPRKGEGDPVKNKPEDVLLLRKVLRANKQNVAEEGGVDAGLIKAINFMQTKAGIKRPDGVVDPGQKTWKSMLPKYLIAKKEADNLKMVRLKFKGKELFLTEADYNKMVVDVFKKLDRYASALVSNHKTNMEIYQEYLDTAMIRDGYVNAITQAVVMSVGRIKFPKSATVGNSISAVGRLERVMKARDIHALEETMKSAEMAVNAFAKEVARFLKEIIGSAETTVTVLQVTSATSFAVVTVLAAPVVATGMGVSAATAGILSSGGVAVLSSTSTELGKAAAGQKMSLWESVQNVAYDGTIALATAGLSSKIPLKFVEKMANGVAPKLASKVPGISAAQLQPYIANFLTGTGQETIKSAVGEGISLLGKSMRSGKKPTEKQFDDAVSNVLMTLVTAGLMKNLGTFQKKWAYDAKASMQAKMMPDIIRSFRLKSPLPPVLTAKLYADVWNKVSEEATKVGINAVITSSKASNNPATMQAEAKAALERDAKFRKLVEAEMKKALKKNKIDVK